MILHYLRHSYAHASKLASRHIKFRDQCINFVRSTSSQSIMKGEKTLDYQQTLPDLPVPTLEDTCRRYLDSLKPLLDKSDFQRSCYIVNSFQNGVGKFLQEKLLSRASNNRNWLQDWWFKAYLEYRGPLPIIASPCATREPPKEMKLEKGMQIRSSAFLVHAILEDFLKVLNQEVLVAKTRQGQPIDMIQYYNLYCAGRIPGKDIDMISKHIHVNPTPDGGMEVHCDVKHIVVLARGRVFMLNCFHNDGNLLTPFEIQHQLERIKSTCESQGEGPHVASLTAADRVTWKNAYDHLVMLDRQNESYIHLINSAIIALVLDDSEKYTLEDMQVLSFLGPCKNRWFDKPWTQIVCDTGLACSIMDHVHLDGLVSMNLTDDAVKKSIKMQLQAPHVTDAERTEMDATLPAVCQLDFVVDDQILSTIKDAEDKHDILRKQLTIVDKPLDGYGKAFAKKVKINPDSIAQMAIHLGYYMTHGRPASAYESATTRLFYHGRTETVRSCSYEMKLFAEAMTNADCSMDRRRTLLHKASEKQKQLMTDACLGQGVDRHLFGLKRLAQEDGMDLPEIFTDPAWIKSGGDANFVISTSLSGFTASHGICCPMVIDGYGAFYTIEDSRINMAVSTWNESEVTNCRKFYDNMLRALNQMEEILSHNNKL